MNLGFKDRFVPLVEEGDKQHSIRGGKRWKVGMRADLFARPRQRGMRLLFRAIVTKVEDVSMVWVKGKVVVSVEGVTLSESELDQLAWRDGFRAPGRTWNNTKGCWQEMLNFWVKENNLTAGSFSGQIIHWDASQRFMDKSETCYRQHMALARAVGDAIRPQRKHSNG